MAAGSQFCCLCTQIVSTTDAGDPDFNPFRCAAILRKYIERPPVRGDFEIGPQALIAMFSENLTAF